MHRNPRPHRFTFSMLVAIGVSLVGLAAFGHGGRVSLFFWGTFPKAAFDCQRVIADSINQCAVAVLALRTACHNAEVSGDSCDRDALQNQVNDIRRNALDRIDRSCTDRQSAQLGFLGVIEVQSDVSTACTRADTQLSQTLYPTANAVGGGGASPAASCQRSTALVTGRLLRHANRVWQLTFNRIARRNFPVSRSLASVDVARRRVAHGVERLVPVLSRSCAPEDFLATYGRSAHDVLTEIAYQSECLAGAAFVQDRVHCDPTPTTTPTRPTATATPTPSGLWDGIP